MAQQFDTSKLLIQKFQFQTFVENHIKLIQISRKRMTFMCGKVPLGELNKILGRMRTTLATTWTANVLFSRQLNRVNE